MTTKPPGVRPWAASSSSHPVCHRLIPEKLEPGVLGLKAQGPQGLQVLVHQVHLHRRPGQQAGKADPALPEGLPGMGETQALPGPGEPGINGAPVAAGELEDQVEAPPAQPQGKAQRLTPGLAPPVHHQQLVQPGVAGHHLFGALGDQVGEVAVRPGLLQGARSPGWTPARPRAASA